ncbi:MAG TPA: hypothetical protein VGC11_13400 [Acidimicrobiia bacterium]
MFSTIIDVIVGLAFVFFIFSLLVSGINELVRKMLNTRAKALWKSIGQILDGETTAFQSTKPGVALGAAPTRSSPGEAQDATLAQRLFDHPIIKSLDPARPGLQSRVHHIPNREFARAVVDLLTPRDGDDVDTPRWDAIGAEIAKLPPELGRQFQLLYEEAGGDLVTFRRGIEDWFDTRMQRVSDWYTKRTRWVLAAYGALVAGAFNVSAIGVTAELYENDVVRDAVVQLADAQTVAIAGIDECADRECIEARVGEVIDTGLPIWWRGCTVTDDAGATSEVRCGFESGGRVFGSIAGWAITAAALSMGASFWFAVLKRAIGLRKEQSTRPAPG